MTLVYISVIISLSGNAVLSQDYPCNEFNMINTQVRDGTVSKVEALVAIRELMPRLREYFYKNAGTKSAREEWAFPLAGYNASAIGGVNGSGYIQKGYDYFDGNNHGGHPAHDIFIHDGDQDAIDDYTGKAVNVLSVTNGVVVAAESEWEPGSNLRGGKYIYIYDPGSEGLFYYAHNRQILVKPGDMVKAGDIIAEVGRTGLNAYRKRSPTHLHIMYLHVEDGYPKPQNIYKDLLSAKTK
jgi:murein DD-endopeptidase MepM/ murein hydrolase activator NlpD